MGSWSITDAVTALRVKGRDRGYRLSQHHAAPMIVGASASCDVTLASAGATVGDKHAVVWRDERGWMIRSLDSSVLVRRDGDPLREFHLSPGIEIGIGDLVLIAESEGLRRLRALVARFIGFAPAYRTEVDHALRLVRAAATGLRPLLLTGDSDLVFVARRLHLEVLGAAPFVVCDRKRSSARSVLEGLVTAGGGTLCLAADQLPPDMAVLLARRRDAAIRVQVIVCARTLDPELALLADPFVVRPLRDRPHDVGRVIDQYAKEAAAKLDVEPALWKAKDARNARSRSWAFSDIERAALRLLAMRKFGRVTYAARYLNISHVALTRWLSRGDAA